MIPLSAKRLLELRNDFNKGAGYKISIQKSLCIHFAFTYTSNYTIRKGNEKNSDCKRVQKNKMLRNKLNEEDKRLVW